MRQPLAVITLLALLSLASRANAQTATVAWADVRQTIDGFGGSLGTGGGSRLTPAQADILFSTSAGAGLSLLRMEVWPDGTYPDNNAALLAVARGAKVWAAPWSPPVSMKTSKNLVGGNLAPGSYAAYAAYLVDWVQHEDAAGIPIFALSVQNEPDVAVGDGGQPTCLMSGAEFHDFVLNNLGPIVFGCRFGHGQNCDPRNLQVESHRDLCRRYDERPSERGICERDCRPWVRRHWRSLSDGAEKR